ncbi:hypothetical protein Tco_0010739 [Tanacetum coccineum]
MRAGHRQRSQFVNLTQTDGLHYHSAAAPVQLRLTVDNKQGTVNELEVDILEVHPMRHPLEYDHLDNVRANFLHRGALFWEIDKMSAAIVLRVAKA